MPRSKVSKAGWIRWSTTFRRRVVAWASCPCGSRAGSPFHEHPDKGGIQAISEESHMATAILKSAAKSAVVFKTALGWIGLDVGPQGVRGVTFGHADAPAARAA